MPPVREIASAADPVAAVLDAHEHGELISLQTSGTTSRPRSVVRTTASWVDSFPHVSRLTGIDRHSRVWVPGPLAATGSTMLVPFDFALDRPRRLTPEEKDFLSRFTDEPAAG